MKKTNSNKASLQEPQNSHTPSSKFLKLLDPEALWDKDNLEDTLDWIRQGLGLSCGLLCGAIPLIGAFWIVAMKLKVVCRKLYDYVRYDLKEIAFPSSLPDPPHIKKRRKLTWIEHWYVLKEATRIYAASWVRDIGPDLRPDDYKRNRADDNQFDRQSTPSDKKEPSMLEDLAVAARGGMDTLRPALQHIYMTRASTYKDALKGFIEGYQEELKRVMEGEKVDKPHSQDDDVKKPN